MAVTGPAQMISNIQLLRGLAAFAVAFYHAGYVIPGTEGKVAQLDYTLYGTMQGANNWWDSLDKEYNQLGYYRSKADTSVRSRNVDGEITITSTYTDDVTGISSSVAGAEKAQDELGLQYEVKDFVMISTDKAVKPTNIMGVTKRIAELIILGLQHQRTRFVAVRFGNVLGSNGSVLPIFEEQIRNGGPVTVTHPEARRYFMLIPEAVQLVLQASTMGHGGEIFILDMGEDVKIDDLARNVIRLAGFEPSKEIKIVYSGLRPGEKLSEELQLQGEGLTPTMHEKIRMLQGGKVDFAEVRAWLDELSTLVESRNVHGLVKTLMSLVPEYHPSEEILALCDVDRHDSVPRYRRGRASLATQFSDAAA